MISHLLSRLWIKSDIRLYTMDLKLTRGTVILFLKPISIETMFSFISVRKIHIHSLSIMQVNNRF